MKEMREDPKASAEGTVDCRHLSSSGRVQHRDSSLMRTIWSLLSSGTNDYHMTWPREHPKSLAHLKDQGHTPKRTNLTSVSEVRFLSCAGHTLN